MVNVGNVVIQNSRFQRFGPGSYGTFMFSTCSTLNLLIEDSVLMCYDSPANYNTNIKTGIEFAAPYGTTKSALYIGNSVAGVRSNRNDYRNCYLSDDAAIYHLYST